MSLDDLDDLYGPCLPLQRGASEAELGVLSQSMDVIDDRTGAALKTYMDAAAILKFPRIFHRTTPILWLIDRDGNARIALEEVVNRDTGTLTYILPRNAPTMRQCDIRLGHPALLKPVNDGEQKSARIAGEIFYDPAENSELPWVISNNSGRFGKRPHLHRRHLTEANALFAKYGIMMREFFVIPVPDPVDGDKK